MRNCEKYNFILKKHIKVFIIKFLTMITSSGCNFQVLFNLHLFAEF